MAYVLLACAILTEIAATVALKHTNGLNIFTHTFLTISVVVLYITSYVCMAQALKLQLEVSIAYAMWSGIGTAAITIIGAMFFRESVHPMKIGGIALIVVGVAMLNLGPSAEGGESAASATASVHAGLPATANVALAGAMMGLPVVGRHRAPAGTASPYRTDTPHGDRYDEHRRPRHARVAWGHRTAPGAPAGRFRAEHLADDDHGRHVPRPRVPGHAVAGRLVPEQATADHDAVPGTPAHRIPELGHTPVAALAAPTYPLPALAGLGPGRDEEDVVEPAAVEPPAAIEPPAAPVTRMPARRRAPIKGVTLLHPYPDRPAVRGTRSA